MKLTEQERKQFNDNGYFIRENAFTTAEIDSLTGWIDKYVKSHDKKLAKVGTEGISRANEISFTSHLAAKDSNIMNFVSNDQLVGLASELIDEKVALYWDQAVYKKPGTKKDFPWHQDNGYTPIEPEQYLTCWIALEDADVENGCIWVLPGSHKNGLVHHEMTEIGYNCYNGDDPGVAAPVKKGGMVVFSSLTFHKSGPNVSDRIRKGYIVQYTTPDAISKKTGELLNRLVLNEG
jgi:phytanoyl-CoA hydroxylase